jgi:hypothetical protein
VHDFFNSGAWTAIRTLAIVFVLVLWLSIGYWVYKDAKRRIEDKWLVLAATAFGLVLPFLGALIYMLFRPPEYLEDVRERELEIRAIEQRLQLRDRNCPVCRAEVDPSFLVCPVCTTRLRQPCENCNAPLEALWQVCPYCETPVDSPAPVVEARPRARKRSSSSRPKSA